MGLNRAFDWLREAREDLESAELLFNGKQYHHACFFAQQAAGKAVKALLIYEGVFLRGCSVTILLRELSKYVDIPEGLFEGAKILDQYYIPPRYPNAFDQGAPSDYYTERQAREAIMIARGFIDFAERIIKKNTD